MIAMRRLGAQALVLITLPCFACCRSSVTVRLGIEQARQLSDPAILRCETDRWLTSSVVNHKQSIVRHGL